MIQRSCKFLGLFRGGLPLNFKISLGELTSIKGMSIILDVPVGAFTLNWIGLREEKVDVREML